MCRPMGNCNKILNGLVSNQMAELDLIKVPSVTTSSSAVAEKLGGRQKKVSLEGASRRAVLMSQRNQTHFCEYRSK